MDLKHKFTGRTQQGAILLVFRHKFGSVLQRFGHEGGGDLTLEVRKNAVSALGESGQGDGQLLVRHS